ncbi:MAG: hypothetical protein H6810_13185 [Phycisphaeraceae bacterium]|nr:MAG: hypothetical protein H6810_13185 [Phycisphaeraceae bacterium]
MAGRLDNRMSNRARTIGIALLSLAGAVAPLTLLAAGVAIATPTASAQFGEDDAQTIAMKRETLARMMKPITVELKDHRLEDVVRFIADVTQADLTPLWMDDRNPVGLDKETLVTLNAKNVTALQFLEMVLEKLNPDSTLDASTWQFTNYGSFEFGPKERLNKHRRVEMYDIADLLMDVPDYDNAPDFDLNTVFQLGGQQGGGGGSQSPFQDNGSDITRRTHDEKVQDVTDLLITTVEPEQWVDNGGEAATFREIRGSLFINAPDYVHRQIGGYPWWPSRYQRVGTKNGRRYVSLGATPEFANAQIESAVDVKAAP